MIGVRINNYEVLEKIAQGGMGDIYLAKHPTIGKKVAIKLLRPQFYQIPGTSQRFFHEAKIVGDIHHPNTVDVLDFGQTPQGECYIIMEYLEGELLSSLIKGEAPLSPSLIGHIGLQLCSVLAAAHRKGVIHRDLKSDNVFLVERDSTENFVKLFDFGIAKLLSTEDSMLTLDGTTLGTPAYMSPEQALGRPINGQTDIYALGILLYYMATNTYPFLDLNPVVVAHMQVSAPLPLPRERFAQIEPGVEKVIIRCLEKEQSARYGSMEEVATELGRACGLEAALYFGKKRSLLSQELRIQPSLADPSGSSLRLLSSEVISKKPPPKKRLSWLTVPFAAGFFGLGAYLSFVEQRPEYPPASPQIEEATQETNRLSPPPEPASTQSATSQNTARPVEPPGSSPSIDLQKLAKPMKEEKPKVKSPDDPNGLAETPFGSTTAPKKPPKAAQKIKPEPEKNQPSSKTPGGLPATIDPFGP